MKYRIIGDSGCDLMEKDLQSDKFEFTTVPLSILIDGTEYIDNEDLNINNLITAMKASKSGLKTACPAPEAFAKEMRKGDCIFCVTLSSKLSGSYNSARLASETVLAESPEKKIFVLDSLSAASSMTLYTLKLKELIERGDLSFEQIVDEITAFRAESKIRFMLQTYDNLIKTGRMSKFVGVIASVLPIKILCGDDGKGGIMTCGKVFGVKKALSTLAGYAEDKIKTKGRDIPVVITNCQNHEDAEFLRSRLVASFGLTNIKMYNSRGLSSSYGNDKAVWLAF